MPFYTKYNNSKIGQTLLDDFQHGKIKHNLYKDIKDIYHFYLDKDTKKRLAIMPSWKRWFFLSLWMLKSLYLRLTAARRFLLLTSFIFALNLIRILWGQPADIQFGFPAWGYIVLLIILMLELKDKWLAHDELAVGRRVQTALMPSEDPVIDGWQIRLFSRPANDVGGDLVDFIEYDNRDIGLAIGDVAGKGLGAALLMAKLQATLRALAPETQLLNQLAEKTNSIFCRDSLPTRFVTLLFLRISPDSSLVKYVNAGHLLPILIKKENISELAHGAPALGLMAKSQYKQESVTMESGDWLLVYTDGFTEAKNEDDHFFGEERFKKTIAEIKTDSAHDFGKMLIKTIDDFAGNAAPNDDLSFIIIKKL